MKLSNEEVTRYSRHLTLPEVGMQGQLKLKEAKVLMIGAGGLGSPLGMYLGAAGIGKQSPCGSRFWQRTRTSGSKCMMSA